MEESESNNDNNNNSNNENNDESNDEITWNDYELDKRANNYIEILLDGIKNYVPSARHSDIWMTYWDTVPSPTSELNVEHNQSDQEELYENDSESKCEEYSNNQAIFSLENLLKKELDAPYKLKVTAIARGPGHSDIWMTYWDTVPSPTSELNVEHNQSDQEELYENDSESKCEEYSNNQAIFSLENLLKKELDAPYKLKVTAVHQEIFKNKYIRINL
ncbi:hypothetical protein Glove_140g222 [Diversispora epigaea]|uniref:Uncharacterized protein n=1 Tax=Diversispora epigaea TaxID=1348612 RepID=A0A397IYX1_9GLOM|nr:hypothetical protein Glove_140g222 [Diversispora epigaea]